MWLILDNDVVVVTLAPEAAGQSEVQGPLQRLAPIISHMKQLDLQEMLEETPSEQAPVWPAASPWL